jgi:hypothetical protein
VPQLNAGLVILHKYNNASVGIVHSRFMDIGSSALYPAEQDQPYDEKKCNGEDCGPLASEG